LGALLGRIQRVANRDVLSSAGSLPEADAELFELLQALESTLIFDPESAWRVSTSQTQLEHFDGDEQHLRWQELDWDRIQRDPRYRGYHYRGASPGVPPTEIQVLIAAISGKLGELSDLEAVITASNGDAEESSLARETEAGTDTDLDPDDIDDERSSRALPIRTGARTRMAFSRLVTRYAAATRDHGFIDKLGPVLAVNNATIFNNLLGQLLAREIVEPSKAIAAQIAAWEMGTGDQPGLLEKLTVDELQAAERVLDEAGDRSTTLRALSACGDYELTPDMKRQLREITVRLLTDPRFDLNAQLIAEAAPDSRQAKALVNNLEALTCQLSDNEIADYIVGPMGMTHIDTHWGAEEIMRQDPAGGRPLKSRCETLMINRAVDRLDHEVVRLALERSVTAAGLSGNPKTYWRIKFAGNGGDLGYWDAAAKFGLSIIGSDEYEFEDLDVSWPNWFSRLSELSAAIVEPQRRSA
jgi:hypothetical protein